MVGPVHSVLGVNECIVACPDTGKAIFLCVEEEDRKIAGKSTLLCSEKLVDDYGLWFKLKGEGRGALPGRGASMSCPFVISRTLQEKYLS